MYLQQHLENTIFLKMIENSFVKGESEVAQLFPTLSDPMDYSLPGSSIHGIFQARILEWVAISFSKGSSWPRNQTYVSSSTLIAYGFFTTETPRKP